RNGELVYDHSWLLVCHAGDEWTELTLPGVAYGRHYEQVLDTAAEDGVPAGEPVLAAGSTLPLPPHTLRLLRAEF
ncbi:MAG: glycogen debranching protein GlgX, partial [Sciscionella sp.]